MGCSSSNVDNVEEKIDDSAMICKSIYFNIKGEKNYKINGDTAPTQSIELIFFLKNVFYFKFLSKP